MEEKKPRLVGINHVAIEVGDIDEALEWYGRIFDFALRGKGERNAFIDMGDQFINLTLVPDRNGATGVERRHIGFVVDDRSRRSNARRGGRRGDGRGAVSRFSRPLGQPASRSSSIRTSSSPRRLMSCAAWASRSTRTTRPEGTRRQGDGAGMSTTQAQMQLSLIVRGQHPPGDIAGHFRDDIELVKRAEAVGFDGIVKGSHYSAHPFEYLQQIPFLGYCAAAAPKLRLICGLVLLPLHKPLDLAEQLATLDIMSGGKLVFGCGIGYRDVEFKAFGVPRAGLGKRFEEGLEAVTPAVDRGFRDDEGLAFRARQRELHGQTAAEADPADLDRRQRRCRDPPRRAHGRLLVHQPAQHDDDDRAPDGCLQARARRIRQAVPERGADAPRGVRRADPRRGDPPGPALSRRKIQGLSRLGPGQGHAERRRFRPRIRRIAWRTVSCWARRRRSPSR